MSGKKTVAAAARDELLGVLQRRFAANPDRHAGIAWDDVLTALERAPDRLWSLAEMENTGGEPDVLGQEGDRYLFVDCAAESPKGRRSLCYDREALESRKEHPPKGNVVDAAAAMGIELLGEAQYRLLQSRGEFDTKTSSWVCTPPAIRELGGALFCDRRYGHVFTYHNGAQSYYAARGFRGMLKV